MFTCARDDGEPEMGFEMMNRRVLSVLTNLIRPQISEVPVANCQCTLVSNASKFHCANRSNGRRPSSCPFLKIELKELTARNNLRMKAFPPFSLGLIVHSYFLVVKKGLRNMVPALN